MADKKITTPKGKTLYVPDDFTPDQMIQAALAVDGDATPQAPPAVDPPTVEGAGRGLATKVTGAYDKYVSKPLDIFAANLRGMDNSSSVFDPVGDGRGAKRVIAPLLAGAAETLAHPIDNAPAVLGLAAQFHPATRALANRLMPARATPAVRGLNSLAANTTAAATGGAVGGLLKDGPSGMLTNAIEQGSLQAGGEGALLGTGLAGRALGRSAGYVALMPSKAERAAIWMGEKGTSRGFTPGRGRRLVKDEMFNRGEGSIGGDEYVRTLEGRTAAANAENESIAAATRGQFPNPSPAQFNVNIPNVTRGLREMGSQRAVTGGLTPRGDRDAIWDTVEQFLNREAGAARPQVAGLLTEGTRPVPMAGAMPDNLGSRVQATTPDRAINDAVPPTFGNTPYNDEFGPLPHQPLMPLGTTKEAVQEAAPVTQGVVMRPGQEVSPRVPLNIPRNMDDATFEEALTILRSVDKDLNKKFQARASAAGNSKPYVPGADEEAGMALRRNLRTDINAVAPRSTVGQQRTMPEVNAELTRDIPWLAMAKDATDEASNIGVGGSMGRSGPRVSLTDLLQKVAGASARPLHNGGLAVAGKAGQTTQLARLLAQLMASHPQEGGR